jgi:hypothetical protein
MCKIGKIVFGRIGSRCNCRIGRWLSRHWKRHCRYLKELSRDWLTIWIWRFQRDETCHRQLRIQRFFQHLETGATKWGNWIHGWILSYPGWHIYCAAHRLKSWTRDPKKSMTPKWSFWHQETTLSTTEH